MPNKPDRHSPKTRQYNTRVPTLLLEAFTAACSARQLKPTQVVHTLMQGFVDVVAEDAQKASA